MNAVGPRTLVFCFDFISNNAYIAWTQLERLRTEYRLEIEVRPVLFAGLLNAYDQLGPAEVRPKAQWMGRNVMRKAKLLGVDLSPPLHHPFNPLLALRASSLDLPDVERWGLIDGLFRAVWVDRLHVSEPETVAAVADSAGLDGSDIVARASAGETKRRLKAQTDESLDAGVFGVPSMLFDDEVFFGYDDFPYLERVLAGNDPLDQEILQRFKEAEVTPSARRRRPHEQEDEREA